MVPSNWYPETVAWIEMYALPQPFSAALRVPSRIAPVCVKVALAGTLPSQSAKSEEVKVPIQAPAILMELGAGVGVDVGVPVGVSVAVRVRVGELGPVTVSELLHA